MKRRVPKRRSAPAKALADRRHRQRVVPNRKRKVLNGLVQRQAAEDHFGELMQRMLEDGGPPF